MSSSIEGVLCDFGGVIVPGPFAAFAEIAQRAGAPLDAVRQINTVNPDGNAWARAERGEIDAAGFVSAFADDAAQLGFTLPQQEIVDVLASLSARRDRAVPAMLDALAECRRRGARVAVITNNIRPMADDPDAAWVFDEFDAVIESCVEGTRKPEERIYRLALGRLGVAAESTVMLDDLGINLKPARALGMHTIKVVDPVVAAAELRDRLIDSVETRPYR